MAGHAVLLEKESAAFTPEKPNPCKNRSKLSQTEVISKKQPEIDELLENTLLNIKLDKSLTKREAEILNWIVAGKTNKEISLKICRTERTVEYHRHRLMRKLGTKTAADLVKRAIVIGIA